MKRLTLNCTPKVRQKNLTFGVFTMKLTYEDKVQIYELSKQVFSLNRLTEKYGINLSNLEYLIRLIDSYGLEVVKKGNSIHKRIVEITNDLVDRILVHPTQGQKKLIEELKFLIILSTKCKK